jgi:hypothetical protein
MENYCELEDMNKNAHNTSTSTDNHTILSLEVEPLDADTTTLTELANDSNYHCERLDLYISLFLVLVVTGLAGVLVLLLVFNRTMDIECDGVTYKGGAKLQDGTAAACLITSSGACVVGFLYFVLQFLSLEPQGWRAQVTYKGFILLVSAILAVAYIQNTILLQHVLGRKDCEPPGVWIATTVLMTISGALWLLLVVWTAAQMLVSCLMKVHNLLSF